MSNITIQEQIAIMQAFADGATIEYKDVSSSEEFWRKTPRPSWNWSQSDYRIAPAVPEYRFALLSNNLIQVYARNVSPAEDKYTAAAERQVKEGNATWLSDWQPFSKEFKTNYRAALLSSSHS
jgi:hypothetical protein